MILGLVCARKGSEGLPGKNLLKLGGKTLLDIAIEKSQACPLIDQTVLNTDIDDGPREGVMRIGRPEHLRGPRVPKWDAWKDTVDALRLLGHKDITAVVDIDVTRPLTTVEDITGTIEAATEEYGGTAAMWRGQASPECDVFGVDRLGFADTVIDSPNESRQAAQTAWGYGGIYVVSPHALQNYSMWPAARYEIPRAHCFDIDDELDWEIVQDQWKRQRRRPPPPVLFDAREFANNGGWR